MKTNRLSIVIPTIATLHLAACSQHVERTAVPPSNPVPATPHPYAADVAQLAALPSPAPNGILLVGSSIFQKWHTAPQDLAPLPITNRAFGGSHTTDQLFFFNQIVPTAKPSLIVWYCGSNDLNNNLPPAQILFNTQQWINQSKDALPQVKILLVSIIRAPQKRAAGMLPLVDTINHGYATLASTTRNLYYLDINPALETPTGDPLPSLYIEDHLHLTPEAYRRITTVLQPAIAQLWNAKTSAR